MKIRYAKEDEISRLTAISTAAFDSDVNVGGDEMGGPPDYDDVNWHEEMRKQEHLYSVIVDDQVIGGALLFRDSEQSNVMYVGRIFIDPQLYRRGYGLQMMRMIETMFPDIKYWRLDTPVWNIRTNRFYQKLGYVNVKQDEESMYYEKVVG